MKKALILVLFTITVSCFSQLKSTNVDFKEIQSVVKDILNLAKNKKINQINEKYINHEFGVFDVYRLGVFDRFSLNKNLSDTTENQTNSATGAFLSEIKNQGVLLKYYPKYNCDTFSWNKKGLFYSDKKTTILSQITTFLSKEEMVKYTKKEKESIAFVQKYSVRIVVTESDLVFYLTKIKGKWYISIVDRVTTSCDA